jgi:hypothetical protein
VWLLRFEGSWRLDEMRLEYQQFSEMPIGNLYVG